MKKYLFITGCALIAALACSKEEEKPKDQLSQKPAAEFRMQVNAGDPATRTIVSDNGDGTYAIQWQAGDALGVYEVGNEVVQAKAESDPLTAPQAQASFGITLTGEVEAPYDYTFVYPASALSKKNDKYLVTLPSEQVFSATSFDLGADVLVSEHLHYAATRPTSVNATFARLGATARMVIKAPDTEERVERIIVSTTEANLAGAYYLTPASGALSDNITAGGSKSLQLIPAASTAYSGDIVVWFRLTALTLSNNFTVIVRTDSKTYTKTIDLAAASRTLAFQNGKLTKFGVDMSAVEGQDNTYEGYYAEFTVQDVRGKGVTGSTYTMIDPYSKEFGDVWTGKVNYSNGGFGMRKSDSSENDCYLLLPKFKDGIATVTVTLSQAMSAGNSLLLTSTAKGKTGDVASLTTVANQMVYTFDLSGESVSQAYLRSGGEAAYIQSVQVVSKADSREALASPTGITASLDANVNNLVYLQWNTVKNASAYQIDYTPAGGSTSSMVVAADDTEQMQCTLEGLQYSKSYSFAVTAIANRYFSKNSVAASAASALSTKEQPNGLTVDVIDVAFTGVTGGYTDWSKQGATAVYSGKTKKGNNVIQTNEGSTNDRYGIWTTSSGGHLRSVTITLIASTTNTVDVYAKNEAYSSAADMWDNSKKGTKIGSVTGNGSTEVKQKITVSENYSYIGIRSYSGVVYISEIRIEWSTDGLPLAAATTLAVADANITDSGALLEGSYAGAAGGIYEAGFYWDNTKANLESKAHPEQVVTTDGSNATSGNFSCQLGSLDDNTTYWYRAYVLEFDASTQTYVEHYGASMSFTTLAKKAYKPGGWLEMTSYTTSAMAGTTTSTLDDLYQVTHYATMNAQQARNYTILYDPAMYASYWVAYPLCAAHFGTGRDEDWGYDPDVPKSRQTSVKHGYGVNVASTAYPSGQHYARGHQMANADRNGQPEMMAQTYFSTNMTPQLQNGFNGGVWAHLEEAVRGVVANNLDTVYVVTGAAFRKKGGNETIKTITNTGNDNKVLPVPNYYYKVLLRVKWNGNNVAGARAVGFWLEHRDNYPNGSTNYLPYVTTVDQIEEWTGFDFFSNLSAELQATCEAQSDWNAFKNY